MRLATLLLPRPNQSWEDCGGWPAPRTRHSLLPQYWAHADKLKRLSSLSHGLRLSHTLWWVVDSPTNAAVAVPSSPTRASLNLWVPPLSYKSELNNVAECKYVYKCTATNVVGLFSVYPPLLSQGCSIGLITILWANNVLLLKSMYT